MGAEKKSKYPVKERKHLDNKMRMVITSRRRKENQYISFPCNDDFGLYDAAIQRILCLQAFTRRDDIFWKRKTPLIGERKSTLFLHFLTNF